MKPSVKYALFGSAFAIVYSLILFITDLKKTDMDPYLEFVATIVLIIFMVLAMREQKKLDGGFISYGKAFSTGLIFYIISTVIISIFAYINFTIIDPDLVQFTIDKQREKMEAAGTMTAEQVDQAMNISSKFMTPTIMCLFFFIGSIVIGAIIALIAAAFVKKEQDPFAEPTASEETTLG